MKKIILNDNDYCYEAKYIISKKKYATYYSSRKSKNKYLEFYKNNVRHRPCNLGPQSLETNYIEYYEYGKLHNLYGYTYINKQHDCNCKRYFINNIHYEEDQFFSYISLYNKLSYKRIY